MGEASWRDSSLVLLDSLLVKILHVFLIFNQERGQWSAWIWPSLKSNHLSVLPSVHLCWVVFPSSSTTWIIISLDRVSSPDSSVPVTTSVDGITLDKAISNNFKKYSMEKRYSCWTADNELIALNRTVTSCENGAYFCFSRPTLSRFHIAFSRRFVI